MPSHCAIRLVSRVGSSSHKSGLHLHVTEPRERENRPNVPLLLGFPPPRVTDATFYPLCGPVPDSMNPAAVRSTSETNRRCMRLSTIVQRACDRYNPLANGGRFGFGSSSRERKRNRDTGH